ncbi:MAG: hypothetical protein ACJ8FY_14245 [Gemmataceae bacterium]
MPLQIEHFEPYRPPGLLGKSRLVIVVVCLALAVFTWSQLRGLLPFAFPALDDDAPPLELPDGLVVAHMPACLAWRADSKTGGLIIMPGEPGIVPVRAHLERLDPPWKETKPGPDVEDYATVSIASFDGQFMAQIGMTPAGRSALTIIRQKTGEIAARIDPFPSMASPKILAWHPKQNAFVLGVSFEIQILSEPDWSPKVLATAVRDQEEWTRRVQAGQEETGFHPNEFLTQIAFDDTGTRLLCAMDRGLRVYDWPDVQQAKDGLPVPKFSADSELVTMLSFINMRMCFSAQYDPSHKRVLYSGLDGKLEYFDLDTEIRGTLLTLPKPYFVTRMEFLDNHKVLCCEIARTGTQNWPSQGLYLLDYGKLCAGR